MRGIIIALFVSFGAQWVSATEVTIGVQNAELEKIQFLAAVEAVKNNPSAEDRNIVIAGTAYPNGDAYYLSGNLGKEWVETEWNRFYEIARWLVQSRFRVIMNPVALVKDVREAIQNPTTTVIIWSSHGLESGIIYDAKEVGLPKDVFTVDASPSIRQIVLSNCHGEISAKYYLFPPLVHIKHWTGLTTSDDLFQYLFSDQWNKDLGFH